MYTYIFVQKLIRVISVFIIFTTRDWNRIADYKIVTRRVILNIVEKKLLKINNTVINTQNYPDHTYSTTVCNANNQNIPFPLYMISPDIILKFY